MILFDKKAAIKSFYYLMSVDGAVTDDETECLEAIGAELDAENFAHYREEIMADCEEQLHSGIDPDEEYELVLEGIDSELVQQGEELENGITLRLLVWDMLVIAFSNEEYSSFERKVIKHIVRVFGLEHSVFLEMEQHIKAGTAVKSELALLQNSSRPYNEIRPQVDELEHRLEVIYDATKCLIEDELYTPVEKIALPSNKIYKKVAQVGDTIASETTKLGKKTVEAAESIGKKTKTFFASKKVQKSQEDSAPDPDPVTEQ